MVGGQPDFVISIALKNFMILKLDLAKSIFIDNFYPILWLLPSCGVLIDDVVTNVSLIWKHGDKGGKPNF